MRGLIVLVLLVGSTACSAQFANFDSCTGRPTFIVGGGSVRPSVARSYSPKNNSMRGRIVQAPKKERKQNQDPLDRFVNPRWL